MSTVIQMLSDIESELHTLETATPRNSATVERGGLQVVDEGSIIVAAGGTVFFDEGGSAVSDDYSIEDSTGWQIGTERRGSSILVLNDVPGESLEAKTADSSAVFEEIVLEVGQDTDVELQGSSSMIVQMFHVTPEEGDILVDGEPIYPTKVVKSRKDQRAFSYMTTLDRTVTITSTIPEAVVRVLRLSVNNAA